MAFVPELSCVSQDSDALVSQRGKQPGKPDAKSLGINSKSTVRKVYATSSKYPGKERTIAWKNTNPHQRSPYAVKFEDRSHEETERQQRCARSKAWMEPCRKHLRAQRERLRYILLTRGRTGYSRLRQQKNRRKESL